MKKIKHSKYKNTGILFELLTRQVTVDTLDDVNENISLNIIRKFFHKNSELYKEYKLYEVLLKNKLQKESRAESLLSQVIVARKKINSEKLNEEKYRLVKEIKSKYDIKNFLTTPINNYKIFGSIYAIFESNTLTETSDLHQLQLCESAVLDFILKRSEDTTDLAQVNEAYSAEDEDIRLLAYKLLIEKFNKKYKGLGTKQKKLLREYINNLSNTNNLREYVNSEVDTIHASLETHLTKIDSKVTSIKLKESMSMLAGLKSGKVVKEPQLQSLLYYYEMVDEMERVHG